MRAMTCPAYGPPEIVEPRELPTPEPGPDDVLVRVRATTVTAADCAFRSGRPFAARLYAGLVRPRFPVLGGTFAGDVAAVGANVRRYSVGDRVLGLSPHDFGAHAEFLCLAQDRPMARITGDLPYTEAASIVEATTALTFLRDVSPIRPGQKVLVNGATGSVGSYGVQLAKHYGAEVTAVCGPANADLARSLGAERTIDRTRADPTRPGTPEHRLQDVFFDAAGKSSFGRARRALTPTGTYMTTAPDPSALVHSLWTARGRGRTCRFATAGLRQSPDTLAHLDALAGSGAIRAVIDGVHPLEDLADAYRRAESGRKAGTVVVTC
ncbi:NADPH:quinone reductase-like Zn-dependent oxidoreductase [Nocardiopsis sp. Huas11]|uniref:NAD(P)-dependent alcohol dehydrogenase n=1 Tax=Nocardiopsis sp. Huas11 TaxID=2183912 RepID=UPI000EAC5D1E|nr:NAD(P)-dependent alcohol dehydrogenase [Nocardiopsis sp. Huas11]RKS06433.1 NADPH:quinone reductase-like Zn-dependent oxidoreductase [Nocardiopsis sp. Huas11]